MKLDYTRIIGLVVVGISITVIFGTMLPQNDMDHSENLSEPLQEIFDKSDRLKRD